MPDKPGAEQADPEVAALAAAIAGEEVPVIIEGKDSVSDASKPASDGKPPVKGDGEAASEGMAKPGDEGDGEPGEGGDGGGQEDPLKDLAGNKEALKGLLEHPHLRRGVSYVRPKTVNHSAHGLVASGQHNRLDRHVLHGTHTLHDLARHCGHHATHHTGDQASLLQATAGGARGLRELIKV